MPSGYTYIIEDREKVSGSEFILRCARQFGALITMRDEPMDAEIPTFTVSPGALERIETAKQHLEKYKSMSIEEAEKLTEESYQSQLKSSQKIIQERLALKAKYLNTLEEVKQWNPPTNEHVSLKEFAIKQIEDSIYSDCNTSYYEKPVVKSSGEEYLKELIESYEDQLKSAKDMYQKEIESVASRNQWIKDLKESLSSKEEK
ncbi:hypothetical protein M3Y14_34050 (plasmid) [Bacillus thuringiensis]|uniref:hypothetical protein n=1 Tax=Bacillus thuringiensis TaxID=1428 RepID=UPI00222462D6|nr:hypothetical protein [Bacillus thuringiensis]UYX56272.1 hypothetical protein M3Y14_34050 [Bacillus thuringiensis]